MVDLNASFVQKIFHISELHRKPKHYASHTLHKYHPQTARDQTHPQTKSLPWIPTCKTSQPNSFGYEARGSLEAHREALVQMPDYMRCNGERRQPSAAPV